MRQHRWLDLIKDYDLEVHYHPRKANVVVDALSRKSYANEVQVAAMSSGLCAEFERLNLGFVTNAVELVIEPTLEQEIRKGQLLDAKFKEIAKNIVIGKAPCFSIDDNGTLWFGKRLCVPEIKAIRDAILREAHESAYSTSRKYQDVLGSEREVLVVRTQERCC